MNRCTTVDDPGNIYPFAAIRGHRITRLKESRIARFDLDHETAEYLDVNNLGVFIGNCGYRQAGALDWVMRKLEVLASLQYPSRWIFVAARQWMADDLYGRIPPAEKSRRRTRRPEFWDYGNATITTPEGLRRYSRQMTGLRPVAGIVLIDISCNVHRARGEKGTPWARNDRPQRVADFRADCALGGWRPPLLLFTAKPAKSVNTCPMLSPYCLDGWWFVEGLSLRVGHPRNPI